jgi:hypothetical protein
MFECILTICVNVKLQLLFYISMNVCVYVKHLQMSGYLFDCIAHLSRALGHPLATDVCNDVG